MKAKVIHCKLLKFLRMSVCVCEYIYIYMCVCVCVCLMVYAFLNERVRKAINHICNSILNKKLPW
jgi:hypothetical protein